MDFAVLFGNVALGNLSQVLLLRLGKCSEELELWKCWPNFRDNLMWIYYFEKIHISCVHRFVKPLSDKPLWRHPNMWHNFDSMQCEIFCITFTLVDISLVNRSMKARHKGNFLFETWLSHVPNRVLKCVSGEWNVITLCLTMYYRLSRKRLQWCWTRYRAGDVVTWE